MGAVRMTSLTIALLTPLALLAACGDGIDEHYGAHGELVEEDGEPAAEATTTTTEVREFGTFRVDHPDTDFDDSIAIYSGASNAVHVGDTWFVAGFDNQSDVQQPERGALWRSDDLETWQRIGLDISDSDSQQSIAALVQVDDTLLAVGNDFLNGDVSEGDADAVVWRSTDDGEQFDRFVIERDAYVDDAVLIDGVLWAVGGSEQDGDLVGQLWRSTDEGRTWDSTDPEAVPSPGAEVMPLGPLAALLPWDGSLIAVGTTVTTDPQGGNYFLPRSAYALDDGVLPVDLAIWYSDDGGEHWNATRPQGLAGVFGAAGAQRVAVVGDQLVIGGTTADGFDPSSFDSDTNFEDFGKQTPTIWVCDYTLQRCTSDAIEFGAYDFAGVALAGGDDFVAFAADGVDLDSDSGEVMLGVLDPLTGASTAERTNGELEQVEVVVIEDDTIYWFGRDPDTNLMHAATSAVPS